MAVGKAVVDPRLAVTYCGLGLRSPVIVASCAWTETAEQMRRCEDNGAGAVVVKSYTDDPMMRASPTPRFRLLRRGGLKQASATLYSYEQAPAMDEKAFADEIAKAKGLLHIPVIASIVCVHDENWISAARAVEAAGADALELNVSCPHGSISFFGGDVENDIVRVAGLVREAVGLPLILKVPPQLTTPASMVRRLQDTGIQGVVMFNRFSGLDIDVEAEAPILHGGYAGHGGAWALQYSLRWIATTSPHVSLDISASGGPHSAEDVVKLILAGAKTVQVGTAIYFEGLEVLRLFNHGIAEWMERKGYSSIEQFRGIAAARVKKTEEIDREKRVVARINALGMPPCQAACPLGVRACGYIEMIAEGKVWQAALMAREKNPLSAVCGYICDRPCEQACVRAQVDEPIAIAALKRFAHDRSRELESLFYRQPAPQDGKRVAVIGSGPGGLVAAHDLALAGHAVTVFEASQQVGGMLAQGIPIFRLPPEVLAQDVKAIEALGVEFRLGERVDEAKADGIVEDYDAVVVACGALRPVPLGVPGDDLPRVQQALPLLRRINAGEQVRLGPRVVVIGGGDSAVDAARAARRCGGESVVIAYRRSRGEMPAREYELVEAEEEGVRIQDRAMPVAVRAAGDALEVEFVTTIPGCLESDGRRQPVPLSGTEFRLLADDVIVAVGQRRGFAAWLRGFGLTPTEVGGVSGDPETGATTTPKVFLAGEFAGARATAIEVAAHGRRVARAVDAFLRGQPVPMAKEPLPPTPIEKAIRGPVPRSVRQDMPRRPGVERVSAFALVELGLTDEQARLEAGRCLMCGGCSQCWDCYRACGHFAVSLLEDRVEISDACTGCGFCVEICPEQVIELVPGPKPPNILRSER
jgi:dihydroorotate dehydrogenase subfamily 1